MTSLDGGSWNLKELTPPSHLQGGYFFNNEYIIVGESGTIISSLEGSEWTSKTTITSKTIRGITNGINKFVLDDSRRCHWHWNWLCFSHFFHAGGFVSSPG